MSASRPVASRPVRAAAPNREAGAVVRAARIFVRRSRPVAGLRVDDFSPKHGWPGTIISITGHGFSPVRDSNAVYIGAERALVVEADPNRLLVVTP